MVGLQLRSTALAYGSAPDKLQVSHSKCPPENELRYDVFYNPGSFNNLQSITVLLLHNWSKRVSWFQYASVKN